MYFPEDFQRSLPRLLAILHVFRSVSIAVIHTLKTNICLNEIINCGPSLQAKCKRYNHDKCKKIK